MASKTLARAGASLINRLRLSNPFHPLDPSSSLILPHIPSNPSAQSFPAKFQTHWFPPVEGGENAEILKILDSPERISFPCGLPSLRFFIEDGNDALVNEPLLLLPKRTYQPSHIKRKRTHGFLARKATRGGRKVIARRLAKGRARITIASHSVSVVKILADFDPAVLA
ncbi:uncharacterized protein LOC103719568 isoform X2 [Phoenix dactylifera]|uniref:Large ribosomal subunit protein bL34m n=1 Tax=Phoenix dactylifera TaxID=42345 RepID=A0A8B7CVN8_PHODC|nr:uncharacterized protein LOC103719568 isoform X2 [Phoenix dactylifera]